VVRERNVRGVEFDRVEWRDCDIGMMLGVTQIWSRMMWDPGDDD